MRKLLFASIFIFSFSFIAFGQVSPCPVINLIGPASVPEPNGSAIFSVFVLKDPKDPLGLYKGEEELEYIWTVEKGKIIGGQGTPSITIEVDSQLSSRATIEVEGLPKHCQNKATEIIWADKSPEAVFIEEFSTSAPQLDKSKLDNLIVALKDDLTTTAYIIIYADEKTSPKKLRQKEQQIRKYLLDKNHQANRIVIVNGGKGKDLIRLFIVPQGAQPPTS